MGLPGVFLVHPNGHFSGQGVGHNYPILRQVSYPRWSSFDLKRRIESPDRQTEDLLEGETHMSGSDSFTSSKIK